MHNCVFAKFTQNHELLVKLIETGEEEIVEDSPIDYFWGCGKDNTGLNNLGLILMSIRGKLKNYPRNMIF